MEAYSLNCKQSIINKATIQNKFINSFDEIISKYSYFIFDCDGVIWRENEVIENCVLVIRKIFEKGGKVFFLSNTNKNSRLDLKEKFSNQCKLDVDHSNIYTSSYLISKYIKDTYKDIKNVYLIGSSGLEEELEEKGFKVYGGPTNKNIKYNDKFSLSDVASFEVEEDIHACVCGFDEKFNYFKLVYAGEVIRKTNMFFGTNCDTKTRMGKKLSPGSYCFIKPIETFTGKTAEIVAKPNPMSLKLILSDHNIEFTPEKFLMIGDNLKTDIQYAVNNQIDSLLVLTGVTFEEDLNNINEGVLPTYILKKF